MPSDPPQQPTCEELSFDSLTTIGSESLSNPKWCNTNPIQDAQGPDEDDSHEDERESNKYMDYEDRHSK